MKEGEYYKTVDNSVFEIISIEKNIYHIKWLKVTKPRWKRIEGEIHIRTKNDMSSDTILITKEEALAELL